MTTIPSTAVVLNVDLIQQYMKREKVHVQEIWDLEKLVISFKSIRQIDNLQGFERLTRLKLDNNLIPRIERIDHLVNLVELDLSFNQITKIEGLDTLVNLRELYLFSNQISTLEGMDCLTQLRILSLGDNQIDDLDSLLYLRQFEHLQALTLKGNPVAGDDDYKLYLLAHIRGLRYLDYQLVKPAEVRAARNQYQTQLQELEEKETIDEARREADRNHDEQLTLAQEANVAGLDTLFDTLLGGDGDQQIMSIAAIQTVVEGQYRPEFNRIVDQLREFMLGQHALMVEECRQYDLVMSHILEDSVAPSIERIRAFNKLMKRARRQAALTPEQLDELVHANSRLYDELMDIEFAHVEKAEDIITEHVTHIRDIFTVIKESVVSHMRQLHECEEQHFELMIACAQEEITKVIDGEGGDRSEEEAALLSDKTAVTNALKSGSGHRSQAIQEKEDMILDHEKERCEERERHVRRMEDERNRARVSEIWNLNQEHRRQIQELREGFDEDDS
eukprot:gnl/Trimastix_PCT/1647.p1 GENE.gnl/Trimastix_PCT/1647~~gnl/Trimastix_PCT/1647.p1  ORF type:complete len:505 (+),score=191.70 gnl/Trimastix_PCT/1647:70-1584(+)